MAREAAGGGKEKSVADQLRDLGVTKRHVLIKMAESGQLLAARYEMPHSYHHEGRAEFDKITTPRTSWGPLARPLPGHQKIRRKSQALERSTVPHLVRPKGLLV